MGPFLSFLSGAGGSSAISGVSSILGGALGYAYNKKLMQAQQAYNTSERLSTQQYNTSEREAAQAYNTGEREAQNAYAEQMYNTYSSPEALVRQYEAAGLNPRLAIGANSAGSVAASSGHSATVSPQSSGMLGITPPYQDVTSFSQGFANIANALKAIGEAKRTGVETRWLEDSFNDRLREMKYGADAQQFAAEIAKINVRFLPKEKRLELRQMITDIAEGKANIEKIQKETKKLYYEGLIKKSVYEHIDTILYRYTEKIQSETYLNDASTNSIQIENLYKPEKLQAEIFNTNVDTYLKQHQGDLLSYQSYITQMDAALQDLTFGPKTAYTFEQYQRGIQNLGIMQAKLIEELKLARNENDSYKIRLISSMLEDIGIAIGGSSHLIGKSKGR